MPTSTLVCIVSNLWEKICPSNPLPPLAKRRMLNACNVTVNYWFIANRNIRGLPNEQME